MSCVCALMAAVPTKAMLAARGPFWVCTWDQHWIRLLTKCCFSVSSLGVPFLKDESIQPPNHRHLLGMLRGTTGICTGWHPWPSACWWPTPLESRDNPGHLRPHQTLGTGNRGSLASTRKGVGEALLGWVALMWPLNPALGVCLGGSLSCSLGPRLSWLDLQGLQREFTCPGHNQTLLWLSLCLSPEPALCSFDRL